MGLSNDTTYLVVSLGRILSWHVSKSDDCATTSLWSLKWWGRKFKSSGTWGRVVGSVFADVSLVWLQPLTYIGSGSACFFLEDLGTTILRNVGDPSPSSDKVSHPEDLGPYRHRCENLKSRSIKLLLYTLFPDYRKSII